MFRKAASRAAEDGEVFADEYWHQYTENYCLMKEPESNINHKVLHHNSKRYTSMSSSVGMVAKFFELSRLPVPSTAEIIALLKSPFTQGDVVKTFHLIRFYQLSSAGFFITNSSIDKFNCKINYVGAENWENVMCYLDALLFAMFSTLESFEPILFISNCHPAKQNMFYVKQLSALLRVYVNLMRSGNLITTDLTIALCEILYKLGFQEALSHKQQDSAALFQFLTETLSMPLLTFKVDIEHGGKFSKDDDQKISKERVLFVSLPEDDLSDIEEVNALNPSSSSNQELDVVNEVNPEEKLAAPENDDEEEEEILLEECLEHYFNNSVSVRRELERRSTLEYTQASIPEGGVITINDENESTDEREKGSFDKGSFDKASLRSNSKTGPVRLGVRTRSSTLSIWSLNEESTTTTTTSREVSLPAWMFLKLLPFYTDDNDIDGTARNSKEFVNRRPILPICLKRYSYDTSNSTANRSRKRVIIPPIINLPLFVADDDKSVDKFKLILESAVCHRGNTINLGHFISVTRKDCHNTNLTEEEATNATWYLFDDLHLKARIREKTFKEIFEKEWPYMLFYRLIADEDGNSMNDDTITSVIPPEGSKTLFWASSEHLTPDISASVSPTHSSHDPARALSISSASSTPIPDISPIDPKFVDIRNKYFWYVTDKDNNYYKELAVEANKDGSALSSVTFSPQFRRNSQWSYNTNVSSLTDLMDQTKIESDPSKTLSKSPLPEVQTRQEVNITTVALEEDDPPQKQSRMRFHNHSHKRYKRRRDAYKREKCVIM